MGETSITEKPGTTVEVSAFIFSMFQNRLRKLLRLCRGEWTMVHGIDISPNHYSLIHPSLIKCLLYSRIYGSTKMNKTQCLLSWSTI